MIVNVIGRLYAKNENKKETFLPQKSGRKKRYHKVRFMLEDSFYINKIENKRMVGYSAYFKQ